MHGWHRVPEHGLEAGSPLTLGRLAQVLVADGEQVPRHERRRRLGRQHLHSRSGRVDPQQEQFELQRAVAFNDDLAVQNASVGERRPERIRELREVAIERLEVA